MAAVNTIPRESFVSAIERCEGNLRRAAQQLSIGQQRIYEAIELHDLWPVVNAARVKRLEEKSAQHVATGDTPVAKARRAMKGTE